MELRLGFSPCPNDTFMFDALVHEKIDTQGLHFIPHIADVEELNRLAFENQLAISKLSYHAFSHLTRSYQLLNSGSALGRNCGPLLIAKRELAHEEIQNAKIAIPGKLTTANLLFSFAFPNALNKQELLFSQIESAILNDEVDAGVIIHENRFTYQEKGLVKILDLGNYWEEQTGNPIPLGGICIQKEIDQEIKIKVQNLIRESVQFAFDNPDSSKDYVQQFAQEMDPEVTRKHINLYVNDFSLDLGKEGRKAVGILLEKAQKSGLIDQYEEDYLLSSIK